MENNDFTEFDGYEGPAFFCVAYHNFYPDKPGTQVLILEDGTKIGVNQSSEYSYTFFDHYKQFYKDSFIDMLSVPHVIYTGLGSIRQYETMVLSDDEIDHLNKRGLWIFLYENMTFELGDKKKFYITENKEYRPISYHMQFELTQETTELMYSFELESIDTFVRQNNLKNVTVLTTEYKSKDVMQQKYTAFSLKTKDIFITSLFETVFDKPPTPYQFNSKLADQFTSQSLQYKFWCTNWRYDIHRHLTAIYLADKSVLLSWPYRNSMQEVKDKIWFDIDQWKDQSIYQTIIANDKLITSRTAPFIIDLALDGFTEIQLDQIYNTPAVTHKGNPNADLIPVDYIKNSFCAVVTESVYAHPFANFTEKTTTVIKAMRPFVLVAPAHTLEYLQKLGFKTFSDIWDESYDQETNHEKRMLKVFQTLEWINSKSIEELRELYDKLLPILKHNFYHSQFLRYSALIL